MIRDKDAPEEIVHIRQAWIKAINRIAEAIAYRYKNDITIDGNYDNVTNAGTLLVIESVTALYFMLVDYGEAPIKTEASEWHKKNIENVDFKNAEFKRMMHYRRWFEFMVETLNKYGMLFDAQPKGYSNVEMKSV
jgi:hypothetical protein